MSATQKITSEPKVISVSRYGAEVEIEGRKTTLEWGNLRAAANQYDRDLAAVYAKILRSANAMSARGPIIIRVVQCDSGVGHRVAAFDASNSDVLFSLPQRRADEGMDHHGGGIGNDGYTFALAEAKDIAARLGDRATLEA